LGETRLSTPRKTEFLSLVIDPVGLRTLCYRTGVRESAIADCPKPTRVIPFAYITKRNS
jgi:hypothetical protein